MDSKAMDRATVDAELADVAADFSGLVLAATPSSLRADTRGTRWTNRQLLFHMVFGYLLVRTLLPMVRTLGRLDRSRRFAATLNAAARPFHTINYLGSCVAALVVSPTAASALLNRTIAVLRRHLAAESASTLQLSMRFPVDWDPYFKPEMTVLEVYHYATQHYAHHRRQLTLIPD